MKFNLRQKSLDDFNITFALKYMKYILFSRNAVAEALRYRERTQGSRKKQYLLLNL